jgi:hypothetical protein
MVASQFSPGSGARWLWEIETNGASAKRCAVNDKSGKSSRPCRVVRNGVRNRRRSGKCTQSIWEWMTSKSPAFSATASSSTAQTAEGSERGRFNRRARGQTGTSLALVRESPLANSVTSWPRPTNSSVNQETTRSVPPYNFGGTLSARGAICAMRISFFQSNWPFAGNNKIRQGAFGSLLGRQSITSTRCQKPHASAPAFSFCRVPYASWNLLADVRTCIDAGTSKPCHRCKMSRLGGGWGPCPSSVLPILVCEGIPARQWCERVAYFTADHQ